MNKIIVTAINHLGITSFIKKFNYTPMVLFWHGIEENPDPIIEAECISRSEFEKEINYLINNYEIISIDEFYRRYETKSFSNKEVVLTFDDGYKNNLTIAAPILKKYNLPFTIFLSTKNVSIGKRFYASIPRLVLCGCKLDSLSIPKFQIEYTFQDDNDRLEKAYEIEAILKELPLKDALELADLIVDVAGSDYEKVCEKYQGGELLTWDDVRELIRDYDCTIESHCDDHMCCHKKQSIDDVKYQLTQSKEIIEKETGKICEYFSYPNGDFTPKSNRIVRSLYKMGFSTIARPVYAADENYANIARISAAKDSEKFKLLIAIRTNKKVLKIIRAPHLIKKKISNYWKWFLFRISQLGCLNPISPRIRPWLWKKIGVNIKGHVSIGYDVYFDVGNASLITIEDGVWITSRNLLLCHKRDMAEYKKGDDYNNLPYIKEPIYLKKGCSIGMASVIMPGVTIGEGAIVGTGSLVTKDVPDWCIVTGRPAKIVKEL